MTRVRIPMSETRLRSIAHVLIIVLLCVFVFTCGAYNCYASTTMLTLRFTGQAPNGSVFIGEMGPQTYSCTVVAATCIFQADTVAVENTRALCVYPKGQPTERQCFYWVQLNVKQEKRRSVGH